MPITYVDAGTYIEKATAAANTTVTCPATVDAGDCLVLDFHLALTQDPADPSGWEHAAHAHAGATSPGVNLWVKIADGTEDGAGITITHNSAISKARIYRYKGVDPTTPLDVAASLYQNGSAATAYTLPGITTSRTGCCLIASASANANSGLWTPPTTPATFTELLDDASLIPSSGYHHLIWSGSGATGNVNLVRTTSIRGAAALIALRPAGDPGSGSEKFFPFI